MSQEEIRSLDFVRWLDHTRLAKALLEEGYAPNAKLARVVCRLILISKRLDTFEAAARPDMDRAMSLASGDLWGEKIYQKFAPNVLIFQNTRDIRFPGHRRTA